MPDDPDDSPRQTQSPRKWSQGIRVIGMIPASLLLMMAGFIALFFDDATETEVTTNWIGLLVACVAIGVTALNARIGIVASLALLIPCIMLADSFHGSPLRVFGLPAFPLTCIALILTVANAVASIVEHRTAP